MRINERVAKQHLPEPNFPTEQVRENLRTLHRLGHRLVQDDHIERLANHSEAVSALLHERNVYVAIASANQNEPVPVPQ